MITQENIKDLLLCLGFEKSENWVMLPHMSQNLLKCNLFLWMITY